MHEERATPLTPIGPVVRLAEDVSIDLGAGAEVDPQPRRGTRWRATGSVTAGRVYEPVDSEFHLVLWSPSRTRARLLQAGLVVREGFVVGVHAGRAAVGIGLEDPHPIRFVAVP